MKLLTTAILIHLFLTTCSFINKSPNTRHYCTSRACSFDELKDSAAIEINHSLQELQNDLLSNPVRLKQIREQLDVNSDVELTHDTTFTLVREVVLSTRLPNITLNRSRIADSTIPDAGRGLFAAQDIANGTLITCYPGDALLCEYEQDITDDNYYDEDDEVILWGNHVDQNDRVDVEDVFDSPHDETPLISYAASVDDVYSVIGMPILDQDPAYYGHFANDGGGHIALEHYGDRLGIEGMLSLYVNKSLEAANAKHVPLGGGVHLGTIAVRDIKKDEEILVTYGTDYWTAF